MIRIHRAAAAPEILLGAGVERRRQHEADAAADPAAYASGARQLDFDRAIYAHESVKRELVQMQHEKCAFCEAKPLHVSSGDVEHFRPKGEVRQDDASPPRRPGYYWLTYEWSNLLFACERCNRRHKRSFFPLGDPARRARSPRDDGGAGSPLFIDPSAEDPAPYISFRQHVPIAIDGNARGEQTIDALGLRRPELNADRERHLSRIPLLHAVALHPQVPLTLRLEARANLEQLAAPTAEYSLMCRVAIEALGGLPPPPA